jgi:hypothetical protein
MNYKTWAGLLTIMAVAAIPVTSGEVYAADTLNTEFTVADFKLHSAQELADVCSIETGSEHYAVAISFCYGFFEGAVHYDEAISGLEWYKDLVCPPPEVTRQLGVSAFIDYMAANPQYGSEPPIDAVFRSLIDKWPCEK